MNPRWAVSAMIPMMRNPEAGTHHPRKPRPVPRRMSPTPSAAANALPRPRTVSEAAIAACFGMVYHPPDSALAVSRLPAIPCPAREDGHPDQASVVLRLETSQRGSCRRLEARSFGASNPWSPNGPHTTCLNPACSAIRSRVLAGLCRQRLHRASHCRRIGKPCRRLRRQGFRQHRPPGRGQGVEVNRRAGHGPTMASMRWSRRSTRREPRCRA